MNCPHCGGCLPEREEPVTLVSIRGERQRIVEGAVIGSRYDHGKWMLKVPVVCVETMEEEEQVNGSRKATGSE